MNASSPDKKPARWPIYWAMITEMTVSIAGGTLLGFYLDEYFKTRPILTLILLVLGCVAAVSLLIRLSRKLEEENHQS